MVTTTHRTILQIETDASQVEALRGSFERAFDSGAADKLNALLDKMDKSVDTLTRSIDKLATTRKKDNEQIRQGLALLKDYSTAAARSGGGGGGGGQRGGGGGGGGGGGWLDPYKGWVDGRQVSYGAGAASFWARVGNKTGLEEMGFDLGGASRNTRAIGNFAAPILSGRMGLAGAGSLVTQLGDKAASIPGLGIALGIPLAMLGHGLQSAVEPEQKAEGYLRAAMAAAPYLRSQAGMGVGAGYGLDVTQTTQFAQQLSQSAGGRSFMGAKGLRAALAAQAIGIDAGTSGGLLRTLRPGRGGIVSGRAADEALGDTLHTARVYGRLRGLEGSEINESLAYMINLAQEFGQGGNTMAYENQIGLSSWLGELRFRGMRPDQVGAGFTRAIAGVGRNGPAGAIDVAMMRAAGYSGGGGAAYGKALLAMQEPDPKIMGRFIQGAFGQGAMGKAPAELRAVWIQRALASKGTQVSADEAMKLAAFAVGGGNPAGVAELLPGGTGGLENAARGMMGAGEGLPQSRALLSNRSTEIGKGFIDTTLSLESAQLNVAKAAVALAPALERLSGVVDNLSGKFADVVNKIAGAGGGTTYQGSDDYRLSWGRAALEGLGSALRFDFSGPPSGDFSRQP